jgi:hypothetical protein
LVETVCLSSEICKVNMEDHSFSWSSHYATLHCLRLYYTQVQQRLFWSYDPSSPCVPC